MQHETESNAVPATPIQASDPNEPALRFTPLGILLAAMVVGGLCGGFAKAIAETWAGVAGTNVWAQIGAVAGAFAGGAGWNKLNEMRGRPWVKLRAATLRVFVGLAAYFVLVAVFEWLGKTIGRNYRMTIASLLAFSHIFAVLFALTVWSRYCQRRL